MRRGATAMGVAATLFASWLVPAASRASAKLPVLPTEFTGRQALEIRPPVVEFTGDGSGAIGGFTGRSSIRKPALRTLRQFGRLRWTSWGQTDARATGAIWLDDGIPDEASGTFRAYAVEVRAFRPRNGVFTRLAFVYWDGDVPRAIVRSAHFYPATQYGPGYWEWF